jgi:hypothetical protein
MKARVFDVAVVRVGKELSVVYKGRGQDGQVVTERHPIKRVDGRIPPLPAPSFLEEA